MDITSSLLFFFAKITTSFMRNNLYLKEFEIDEKNTDNSELFYNVTCVSLGFDE